MNINKLPIKICRAEEKDWPQIIDIYNQAILEKGKTADTELLTVEERKGWLSLHLDNSHPILIAVLNKEIIGWCSLSPHRPGRKALERTLEISYYIDKNSRGKGVGTLLFNSAIDFAKKNDTKNLFAILLDVNTISVNILEKFGFQKWGHLPEVAEIDGKICGQLIYGKHI